MTTHNTPKILLIDLEMGESAIKKRFVTMCAARGIEPPSNIFIKYMPHANLLDESFPKYIKKCVVEHGINIVVLDPLGNAWSGDENNKQEVQELERIIDGIIYELKEYELSFIVLHHWRKSYKGSTHGGEMAAGSYKWGAWLDNHVTLEGDTDNITVSCEKNRNNPKVKPFRAKINRDTLGFEYVGDFETKFKEQTLLELFEHFDSERVAIPELKEYAEKSKICSHDTVRKLINKSTLLGVDKSKKTHYLYKKAADRSLFGGADILDAEISTESASE